MKKWLISLLFFVSALFLKAQEAAEAVSEEMPADGNWFSTTTKWTMVYVFSAVIIIIVLRTFRNKAEI